MFGILSDVSTKYFLNFEPGPTPRCQEAAPGLCCGVPSKLFLMFPSLKIDWTICAGAVRRWARVWQPRCRAASPHHLARPRGTQCTLQSYRSGPYTNYRVHRIDFRGPSTQLDLLRPKPNPRRWGMKYTTINSTRSVNITITLQTGSPDHPEIN